MPELSYGPQKHLKENMLSKGVPPVLRSHSLFAARAFLAIAMTILAIPALAGGIAQEAANHRVETRRQSAEGFSLGGGLRDLVTVTASGPSNNLSLLADLRLPYAPGLQNKLLKVFVIALVPGRLVSQQDPVLIHQIADGSWQFLSSPVSPTVDGVAVPVGGRVVPLRIFEALDLSLFTDTEVYVGYGTSDVEMVASGRYGGVYRIRAQTPLQTGTGNPTGSAPIPAEAQAVNTSAPTTVVGNGSPSSCSGAAVVNAVALGGQITFNCGAAPVVINMKRTAKVFNNRPDVTLDGGGKVTLDGGGTTRILYQNTCDSAQVFTTSHCQNQESPKLTVQNITFANGNSTGENAEGGGGGGGAIFVRGGQFKIVNSRFVNNRCDPVGPDVGGGAVRVLSIYNDLPVHVVNSTFGGAQGLGNKCSNGGALSGIGVSYTVLNSLFTHNEAIGIGANPAQVGTPGGVSGGAIYNDGNTFRLKLEGSAFRNNTANEGGGAVFFVSNDRTGSLAITNSDFDRNLSRGFETDPFKGFFIIAASGQPVVSGSNFFAN